MISLLSYFDVVYEVKDEELRPLQCGLFTPLKNLNCTKVFCLLKVLKIVK